MELKEKYFGIILASELFKKTFPFKDGKSQKSQAPNLGCRGSWVTWMICCFTKKLCIRRDSWAGTLLWCQSPVAHSFSLLNHTISSCQRMFRFNAKFDADSLFYSPSHFVCNGHTVHILTQRCLPPPLTSTVKSSLFTHEHSSPLPLADRLHRCHANHSH